MDYAFLRHDVCLYRMYMLSDLGKMNLKNEKYNFINGTVSDHLCQVCAFLTTYLYADYSYFIELIQAPDLDKMIGAFLDLNDLYSDRYFQDTGMENPIWKECKEIGQKALDIYLRYTSEAYTYKEHASK